MAVERLLVPLLRWGARPNKKMSVNEGALTHLDGQTAHILFAVVEGIVGEDFGEKVPDFIPAFDEYLAFQRQQTRNELTLGLLLIENPLVNLWFVRRLRGFSHLAIHDRRAVLARFKQSRLQLLRKMYVAFLRIGASAYYGSEANWSDIHYDGVSVDHPEILQSPRWRPDDPTPVEE